MCKISLFLIYFKYIWKSQIHTHSNGPGCMGDGHTERSFIYLFTPQRLIAARDGTGWSHKHTTQFQSAACVAGTLLIELSIDDSQVAFIGSRIGNRAAWTQTRHCGMECAHYKGWFAYWAKCPLLLDPLKEYFHHNQTGLSNSLISLSWLKFNLIYQLE